MRRGVMALAAVSLQLAWLTAPSTAQTVGLDEPTAFHNRGRTPARYLVIIATERSPAWRSRHGRHHPHSTSRHNR